jgi:hypothetical protein
MSIRPTTRARNSSNFLLGDAETRGAILCLGFGKRPDGQSKAWVAATYRGGAIGSQTEAAVTDDSRPASGACRVEREKLPLGLDRSCRRGRGALARPGGLLEEIMRRFSYHPL